MSTSFSPATPARAAATASWLWAPPVVFGLFTVLSSPLAADQFVFSFWKVLFWLVAAPIAWTVVIRYHNSVEERAGRRPRMLWRLAVIGTVLAALGGFLFPFNGELLGISIGLLLLVAEKRSWRLAIPVAVFGTLNVLIGFATISNLLGRMGIYAGWMEIAEVAVTGLGLAAWGLWFRGRGARS
jgi:hypothetical protein